MDVDQAIDLVRALVWPVTVLLVVLVFRRELRGRVGAIRKAQLPGGVSFELDALEKEVVRTPEVESQRTQTAVSFGSGILPSDRSFTVAEARVELERALRRLSFTLTRDEEFATRNIEDLLLELRASGELSAHVARQAQDFFRLSAASLGAPVSDDDVVSFHTVGYLLASHVSYLTRVASVSRGLWGHDLWQMVERSGRGDRNAKVSWAAITTILPEVAYDYNIFRDAMLRASATTDDRNWPRDAAPLFRQLIVPEGDFLEILVFRRNELRRVIRLFDTGSWLASKEDDRLPNELYYKWPASWGDIGFNTPVTGHTTRPLLPDVADDLLRSEEAVRRMRLTHGARSSGTSSES